MSKAILIMDMPERCYDCDLCYECRDCVRRPDDVPYDIEKFTGDIRMPWCPLVPAIGYVQPVGHMVSWEDDDSDLASWEDEE